jgi:hypothetical protein
VFHPTFMSHHQMIIFSRRRRRRRRRAGVQSILHAIQNN